MNEFEQKVYNADAIGADGFAPDANQAAILACSLVG